MRRRKRTLIAHKKRQVALTFYGILGLGAAVRAQQVLMPPPSYATTPPAVEAERESGEGFVGDLQSAFTTVPNLAQLLSYGPVVAHPHVNYSATYANGVNSAPGQSSDSFIQSLTPGVTFNIGSHWVIDYEPTLTFYSSSQLKNTLNQQVSLSGGGTYEDWVYGLSQGYTISGDPNAQTGTQTSIQTYSTGLNASYRFNSLISSDTSLSQTITSADQFTSSSSWSGTEYLNYQFYPTLTGAIGAVFGYDGVSVGANMTHEQLQGRISWRASRKLSVVIHAGVEDRQFIGAGVPNLISPVFGVSIQYSPAVNTSLSLTADRSVTPSLLYSQASEATTVGINLSQRLFKHFNFSAGANYNRIEYISTTENLTVAAPAQNNTTQLYSVNYLVPDRTDSSYGLNASLSWNIRKHLSLSLTYNYSRDTSSAAGLSFGTSQEGLSVNYHF